ncbi:MAG: DUF3108 domain-containing protein [Kiritimatiellales bacterium]|nr:DUF3108 domain-containing protein [Kiritimatiellales bacterium]
MKIKIATAVMGALLMLSSAAPAAELPFPIGEELVYSITWIGIPMASATVTSRMTEFEGREVLALRMEARTYAFFEHIFRVEDVYETLVDPVTFLPIQYEQNLKERDYRNHEITTFDYTELKAHFRQVEGKKRKIYDIKPDSRDIISFMFFMRSVQLQENTKSQYQVMTDEKLYELVLTTHGLKSIDLPHYERDVPSLEMQPRAMFDGLFVRKGKATVWVSRDPRHLMTLARLSTPFGRVSITLHEVNGPGDDFWITEKKDRDEDEKE